MRYGLTASKGGNRRTCWNDEAQAKTYILSGAAMICPMLRAGRYCAGRLGRRSASVSHTAEAPTFPRALPLDHCVYHQPISSCSSGSLRVTAGLLFCVNDVLLKPEAGQPSDARCINAGRLLYVAKSSGRRSRTEYCRHRIKSCVPRR